MKNAQGEFSMAGFTLKHIFRIVGVGLALSLCGRMAQAQTGYTAPDESYKFDYPQRWKVEPQGEKLLLTAPDGSHYTLQQTALTAASAASPVNDPEWKERAAKWIAPLWKESEFVRAQSLSMDHGQGASFRFKSKKPGDDSTADVWVGVVGKHAVFLLPEKAGQPSQTIGLSVIFQSLTFTDALPRTPAGPARPNTRPMPGGEAATPGAGNGETISYVRQIAPILQSRCRACHNANSASGGLDVSSYAAFLRGGSSGACVLPGKPGSSTLLDYLTGKRDPMPRGSQPLSAPQIALIRQWIAGGAQDDGASKVAGEAGTTTGKNRPNGANATGQGKRPAGQGRMKSAAAAPGNAPALREGYTGHLTPNDLSFTLRLMRDGSATAIWAFSAQSEAHFTGTYATRDGSYFVTLTFESGSIPYTVKTLTLDTRSVGDQQLGRFGLDATTPNRKITLLQLTELSGSTRATGNAGGGAAGKRPGGKKGK